MHSFTKHYLAEKSMNLLSDIVTEWWSKHNPFEDEGLYSSDIKEMYLVGSRAKKKHHNKSDYDVAVIFSSELKDEYTATKLSEILHQSYGDVMPKFKGNDVDLQIFFDDDKEVDGYVKIKLDRGIK